jgi:endonuclease/exonuclease/phosphatase family metal-dependent hydrolase
MKLAHNVLIKLVVVLAVLISSASWATAAPKLTVMTKNMDAGTDFGFFLANLNTDPALGVQLTLNEVAKNNYFARSALLAQEIASAKPDVVGLQEVSVWQTPQGTIDQLQLLLLNLIALGQPYDVVKINTLTSFVFAANVAFTDQDVLIARRGSPATTNNAQAGLYSNLLPIESLGLLIKRGWISADVTLGGKTVTIVTTHLESSASLYGNPLVDLLQAAQATELAARFLLNPYPVIIAGDFNSNATHTPPEQTASVKIVTGYGYKDTWSAINHGNPGFTWPLYLEDPLRDHTNGPKERIDFIFASRINAISVDRTGLKAPQSSDHAGVIAEFGL